MSLIPKKKSIENEYRKIVSLIVFILGIIFLMWYLFHLMYVVIGVKEYDFYTALSFARIVVGIFLITFGYAMYKFIDVDYDRPYLN